MKRCGSQCNKYDENFSIKTVKDRRMFCLVCVDDSLIASKKKYDNDELLRTMNKD